MSVYNVSRAPRVSEKTARLQEVSNQYAFEVSTDATKADIKYAVEKLFDVKVEAVNVVNVKGKNKAFRNRQGRRGDPAVARQSQPRAAPEPAGHHPREPGRRAPVPAHEAGIEP